MPSDYLWLIPLLPFAGFLINGTLGRKLPRALVTAVALSCTAIPAAIVAWLWATMKAAGAPDILTIFGRQPWIQITGLTINFAFTIDHRAHEHRGILGGAGLVSGLPSDRKGTKRLVRAPRLRRGHRIRRLHQLRRGHGL